MMNPWIDRFGKPEDDSTEELKRRVERLPTPIDESLLESSEGGANAIARVLSSIFLLDAGSEKILREVLDVAQGHARIAYADAGNFMRACYSESVPGITYPAICITGPSGTGKSELLQALVRALVGHDEVVLDSGHGAFPIDGVRILRIDSRVSVAQAQRALLLDEDQAKVKGPKLARLVARQLFKRGICFLGIDEMQFLSQSRLANTLVAQILLAMTHTSVPSAYVANYSLLHRLVHRPDEEQQRILGRAILLLPSSAQSSDWRRLLGCYEMALGKALQVSLQDHAQDLWGYSAGLKRLLIRLLAQAYREARRHKRRFIIWDDIPAAYRSRDFAFTRAVVDDSIAYGISGITDREDLKCPLSIDKDAEAAYRNELSEVRKQAVSQSAVDSAMTVQERKARQQLEASGGSEKTSTAKATVTQLKVKSRSADALKAAHEKLLNERD